MSNWGYGNDGGHSGGGYGFGGGASQSYGGGFNGQDGDWSNGPVQSMEYRNSNRNQGNGDSWGQGGGRGFGGGGGGDDCTMIDVQNSDLGKIIGKGGSRIREIQDTSGARVHICKEETGRYETPVKIVGDLQCRNTAAQMIKDITDAGMNGGGGGYGGYRGGGGGGGGFGQSGEVTTMKVQASDCGKIIGKGGSKIREIQDESGARVKICKEEGDGYETPVKIFGASDARARAEEMIKEITEQFT